MSSGDFDGRRHPSQLIRFFRLKDALQDSLQVATSKVYRCGNVSNGLVVRFGHHGLQVGGHFALRAPDGAGVLHHLNDLLRHGGVVSTARHSRGEFGTSSDEGLVNVASLEGAVLDAAKAVNVELSLKGLEFGLIEVPRHDFRPESIDIVDTKRFVPLLPSDDVRKVLRMGVVQHRMELQRKGKASFLIVRTTATSPVRALLCLWFCCWRNHHGKSYVCGCETVCFSFYEAGVCG
mmetsp:Transcript_2351/g.4381  ORF Transcript_2351/g.4381 Transcript_2351/m.4381 type:complete len:235 (+) Transcript_2351:1527-2231(+)